VKRNPAPRPAPDPGLDHLLATLRTRISRRSHGRVFAEVNIDGHQVTGVLFSECEETRGDVEREMQRMPVHAKTGRR
jgi:hypothetical protein